MNGEFLELYNKVKSDISRIDKTVTALSTLEKEKWNRHEAQSIERRADLKEDYAVLTKKSDNIATTVTTLNNHFLELPCKVNENEIKWLGKSYSLLWVSMGLVVIVGIVLGVWMKNFA